MAPNVGAAGKRDVKSLCRENSSGRSLANDHRCVHLKVALLAWMSAMSRKRPCVSLPQTFAGRRTSYVPCHRPSDPRPRGKPSCKYSALSVLGFCFIFDFFQNLVPIKQEEDAKPIQSLLLIAQEDPPPKKRERVFALQGSLRVMLLRLAPGSGSRVESRVHAHVTRLLRHHLDAGCLQTGHLPAASRTCVEGDVGQREQGCRALRLRLSVKASQGHPP